MIRPTTIISTNNLYFSLLRHMPRIKSVDLSNASLGIWRMGPRMFQLFPSTIRSISLNLPFTLKLWLSIPHDTLLPANNGLLITTKSGPKAKKAQLIVKEPNFTIGEWVPSLERLTIRVTSSKYIDSHFLPDCALPSDKIISAAYLNFIKSLPSTLQHIDLPVLAISSDDILMHLTSRPTSAELNFEMAAMESAAQAPDSVRHLVLTTTQNGAFFDAYGRGAPNFLSKLPSSLESLEWFDNHWKGTETLRPLATCSTLRSFTLACHQFEGSLNNHIFTLIPSSLTELTLSGMYLQTGLNFVSLPRTLTSLVWSDQATYAPLSSFDYVNLPPALQLLSMRYLILMDESDFSLLPRTLMHLTVSFNPALWLQRHTCSITSCQNHCKNSAVFRGGGYTLPDDVSRHLPPHLTYLKVHRSYFAGPFFSNLPDALETLEVDTQLALGNGALSLLPCNLTSLSLEVLRLHKHEALDCLPSALRFLKIVPTEPENYKVAVALLPRSLTTLHFEKSNFLVDNDVMDLPRTLLHLIVPASDKLTTKCASQLPRRLTTLKISNMLMQEPRPTKMQLVLAFPSALPIFELNCVTAKRRRVNLENLA